MPGEKLIQATLFGSFVLNSVSAGLLWWISLLHKGSQNCISKCGKKCYGKLVPLISISPQQSFAFMNFYHWFKELYHFSTGHSC